MKAKQGNIIIMYMSSFRNPAQKSTFKNKAQWPIFVILATWKSNWEDCGSGPDWTKSL